MKKVLYIAFNYNHDTGIASKRLRGVAKYLPSFGWQPIVVVPRTSNETMTMDGVKVVETDYQDMISKFMPKSNNTGRKGKSAAATRQINSYPKRFLLQEKYLHTLTVQNTGEILQLRHQAK